MAERAKIEDSEKRIRFHQTWSSGVIHYASDISFVKDWFGGHDVHILAGGVSLYGIDWGRFKDRKTICVNNTIKWFHNPTVHLFLDSPVLQEGGRVDGVPIITKVGNNVDKSKGEVYHIHCANRITDDPIQKGFYSHYSTTHVAISIAMFAGARNIYLWGVEQKFMTDSEFKVLSDFQWLSDWYIKKDILKVHANLKAKGQCFGHFYSPEMPHKRDGVERPYVNAGNGLQEFAKRNLPIFNMSPVHNTPFPFKHPEDIIS